MLIAVPIPAYQMPYSFHTFLLNAFFIGLPAAAGVAVAVAGHVCILWNCSLYFFLLFCLYTQTHTFKSSSKGNVKRNKTKILSLFNTCLVLLFCFMFRSCVNEQQQQLQKQTITTVANGSKQQTSRAAAAQQQQQLAESANATQQRQRKTPTTK